MKCEERKSEDVAEWDADLCRDGVVFGVNHGSLASGLCKVALSTPFLVHPRTNILDVDFVDCLFRSPLE